MKMMTEGDIRTELGWTDSMIHSLLQNPDSPNARRDKFTGGYTYRLYHRDRVLGVAQSKEGLPNGGGVRNCVATLPTPGGRRGSAI
jgi:hypothetical protein